MPSPRLRSGFVAIAVAAALAGSAALALALGNCILDPSDPFDPAAAMPRGPFEGACLDTREQRSIRVLTPVQATGYGMTPSENVVVIANLRHAGQYWVASVPIDGVAEVDFQVEHFPSRIPAAHTELRFRFERGHEVLLVPQVHGRGTPVRLADLVYSVEAVSPVGGEPYDLFKGLVDHYGTAYRLLSLADRYDAMVTREHHRVEQVRLELTPFQRLKTIRNAIEMSQQAQMSRMYNTAYRNCTTELITVLDRSKVYTVQQTAWRWATCYLTPLPTAWQPMLVVRGMIDPDGGSRLPDLDREVRPTSPVATVP